MRDYPLPDGRGSVSGRWSAQRGQLKPTLEAEAEQ